VPGKDTLANYFFVFQATSDLLKHPTFSNH
jgi:hypothetical protein